MNGSLLTIRYILLELYTNYILLMAHGIIDMKMNDILLDLIITCVWFLISFTF